MLKDRIRSL